jgi:hypothetical protein
LLGQEARREKELTLKLRQVEPHKRFQLDTGWWARAHWAAAGLDYASTSYTTHECLALSGYPPGYLKAYCVEQNPALRPFIGRNPQDWRVAATWAGESVGVSLIPKKKLRRAAQVSLIAVHLAFGIKNLKQWH